MNKSFWKLWLRDQLPLLITYILLTDLVALLCYLYQLPMTIFTDLLRFSLPLLIVWLIATVLIAKRRQALLTVLEKCYLLVISLVAGLTTGVIFEKLAFLGLNRLLEIGKLRQPWAVPGALVKTAGLIAGFFIILIVIDLIKIHFMKPTSLWHASATVSERHGATFSLAGGLGIAMLAGAYYITLTTLC